MKPTVDTVTQPLYIGLAALFLLLAEAAPSMADALKVAASIQPVHSLVAGVMGESGRPHLIVQGYGSPHAYQMRPSEAAALYQADLVFWMGLPLENFLQKPLKNVRPPARVVALLDAEGVELLPNRTGGVWHDHDHGGQPGEPSSTRPQSRDPHAWLSPHNARRFVHAIAAELARSDPGKADQFFQNARALDARIAAQESELRTRLAPVREARFVMFHDAFQYFEHAFDLESVGALQLEPARAPGAARIKALRDAIRAQRVRCVFREPQFQSALVDILVEGTDARVGVLDPLGAAFPPGADAWFQMMAANTNAMVRCLGER